jgi:dTDP-4-dehydrorhamnose reductase
VERLLVTGVDGPLGCNIALELSEEFDVLGLSSSHVVELFGVQTTACSASDPAHLAELAGGWEPRWIVHCGPLAASAWENPPDDARCAHELRAVAQLVDLAHELSARLTVITSDVVFSGPRMFHDESSPPACTSDWARATLAMEQTLAASRALVVRTHAFGWSPVEAGAGFAETVVGDLLSGRITRADGCRHATPLLATDLARYLKRAYELHLRGLYHIAGAERTSPFRFAREMATALGLRFPVEPDPSGQLQGATHQESSLSSKRARRCLEMTMPMLGDSLARFAAQRQNGHRERARSLGPLASALELAA